MTEFMKILLGPISEPDPKPSLMEPFEAEGLAPSSNCIDDILG